MSRRLVAALTLAAGVLAILPATVSAHPLGNFTINHYAGIRVARDGVLLDVVVDRAEIPTFQEVRRVDPNGDGTIDAAEAAALRGSECTALAPLLDLRVGASPQPLRLTAAGLSFPPGAGGLPTMRLVCTYEAAFPTALTAGTSVRFEDGSFPERIGWREITVAGDGTSISPAPGAASVPPAATASARLSAYPADLLATPLDVRSAAVTVTPGGPGLGALEVPDATPLTGDDGAGSSGGPGGSVGPGSSVGPGGRPASIPGRGPGDRTSVVPAAVPGAGVAAVPGGVGTEIAGLLEARDLTPIALILSLLTAALLGAGHALTPGHGKTVMAAYLVGARGSARHAVGLGLSVTVSHTLGILVLAGIVVAAGGALPPEAFTRWAPLASALLVLGIGGWLVTGQVRTHLARRAVADATGRRDATAVAATHQHGDAAAVADAVGRDHATAATRPHDGPHEHSNPHDHAAAREHQHPADHAAAREHTHGGVRHRHVPAGDTPITWRNLALLGLAGGIVPSTSALLLLLAAIASGRPAWGLVLVVAFGLGMAAVLGGVGLALVHARGLATRAGGGRIGVQLGRLVAVTPALGAGTVLALGVWLTSQALAGSIVL